MPGADGVRAGAGSRRLLVAIGPAALSATTGDPRAQGRELARARNWQGAADLLSSGPGGSALVVAPPDGLTYAALDAYAAASVASGTAVGVLPVAGDGSLLGAGRKPAPPAGQAAALYSHFRKTFDCDVEYGQDEAEEFLCRIADRVEAAVFHTHCNGADLQLGQHAVCVQADHLRGRPRPDDLVLPCQAGGPCRLSHLPIKGYWGASAMRARIIVLVSCWGFLPADGLLSPEALLGTALLRGPDVEAFIASTRVTYNTPELSQAALAFLELGGTAGELTQLLNRFPGTATPPYVCVGDPDTRIRRASGRPARHRCPAGSGTGAPSAGDVLDLGNVTRLELATRHASLASPVRDEILAAFGPLIKEGRSVRLSLPARHAVAAMLAVGQPATAVSAAPGPRQRFRTLTALAARHTGDLPPDVADRFWDFQHRAGASADERDGQWCQVQALLLTRRGPDQLGYLGAVSRYADERLNLRPGPASHLCGKRMFRITVEFTALDGYRRDVCFCERCGLLADLPATGMPAPFLVMGGNGILLTDSPWRQAWLTAGIAPVGPSLYPASAPRRIAASEPIPLPEAAAGRRFSVALVHGGDHVIIQTPLPPFPPPDAHGT